MKKLEMLSPESQMSQSGFDFANLQEQDVEARRLLTVTHLGLLEVGSIPVFEEATQTAAYLLDAPICIFGVVGQECEYFKAAVGLARMGLMNDLTASRQLARQDSFAAAMVECPQVLAIADTTAHPTFNQSLLVTKYNIRAYLGVPLLASNGDYLGALAILDLAPRNFSDRDITTLQMVARWSMSEYERGLDHKQGRLTFSATHNLASEVAIRPADAAVRVKLIAQMTQELRTPLTSILGMASVLNRQIYGPLTEKQKEYMDIIHHSGQSLLSLVNEIVELGALAESSYDLNLSPVDVEMLCQQALNSLQEAITRREQQARVTVEPGPRLWLLDKGKVRQMLYHMLFSVTQAASSESTLRIHVSRKAARLNITVWTSHPWLGEGLPQGIVQATAWLTRATNASLEDWSDGETGIMVSHLAPRADVQEQDGSCGVAHAESHTPPARKGHSRQSLGLMLSRQLAEIHGGDITLQGSIEAGYRYVISLPHLNPGNQDLGLRS